MDNQKKKEEEGKEAARLKNMPKKAAKKGDKGAAPVEEEVVKPPAIRVQLLDPFEKDSALSKQMRQRGINHAANAIQYALQADQPAVVNSAAMVTTAFD